MISRIFKNPLKFSFIAIVLTFYAYIFGVILSYENAWMNPEITVITEKVLGEHPSFQERLAQAFNWNLMDGDITGKRVSRARFFSHLFLTSNIIFRNWLFHFIPPHPSLSLTWIVALGLCPYFLYKLTGNLTGDKRIALISALVYLCLPGCLIPVMMLFHPAKVFANFFCVFCLYLASKIHLNLKNADTARFKRDFSILVL